ncbi:hypothetical protein [Endozoicomonas sp. YOMI1]|uniref:hypothetical protein n=1 Tax=Endozoicomonas sp. YOMI1 TaxID=2828739 RepID=UPI0021486B91|nr:hypothetical protein [Endozoicomonas sp. YOMI1]
MKATASTYSHPKLAGRVEQQAGSNGTPKHFRSTFNGKRVSNHQSYSGTATNLDECKRIEDAFWQKKMLQGRQITTACVIAAYGNDRTSLRPGFFLQNLCLKNILHGNRKVTPDQVIQEFNRAPDRNNKCKLAIARFKAECCLRGMTLKGLRVTPDEVVKDYRAANAKLELARFKEKCCLRGLALNGRQVTPDAVVKDFPDSPEGKLALRRFKEQCCLRGLALNGQQVTPEAVVKDYQAAKATLELLRFEEKCCLRGLALNGRQVTPDTVIKGYQTARARLEQARFKELCCLSELPLNGQLVTADDVVKDYRAANAVLELGRLKAECFLRGLLLNGQLVTADAVVKGFPDSPEGRLGIAHFKLECCLRGLMLNGHQVTPEAVVKDFPDTPEGKLGMTRFKEQCCLRGLKLNGYQVTPEAVVKDYQSARATLELARFKAECCLRGLPLNGQQVTPEAVVRDYQAANAILGLARFKEQCCLRGLALNGRQVTPDAVGSDYQAAKATLELARFKAECCQRRLPWNGQQVIPDEVVRDYQALKATLELARFKAECCLMGVALDDQQVRPDTVVKDYERGGWLLERAIFYARLALNARELNGNYLANREVLAAFNEVPGDQSSRKTRFLIQRLKQSRRYDKTNEAQDLLQEAWQIVNNASVKDDEQQRLQCILKFMAMQHELPIDHQRVLAEQVLQSIKILRNSFQNSRLHFFFLAYCYINSQPVNGRQIHKDQVLECLQGFPEVSKQRHALSYWFEQCSFEANIMDILLKPEDAVAPGIDSPHGYATSASQDTASVAVGTEYLHEQSTNNAWSGCLPSGGYRHSVNHVNNAGHGHRDHLPDVISDPDNSDRRAASVEVFVANSGREGPYQIREYRDETKNTSVTRAITASMAQALKLKPWSRTGRLGVPDKRGPQLNALTLKTLEIIQEVNGSYTNPPLLVTGSYSRFLQNLCSVFNDIDIICTTEASARALFDKLQALNTDRDSEIPKNIIISPIPGCQAIKLPNAYNIHLKDGDLGMKAMEFQVSVDARAIHENAERSAVQVPGVERPVWYLSFAEETKLMNDTLEYLAENLDPLTEQLLKGEVFELPRTLIFNNPQNTGERVYGLLMRSLLTLNKARQFIALHSEKKTGKHGCWNDQLQEEQQRLHTLTANLQTKLNSHVCRHDFEQRVNDWLSTTHHVNDYQIKRKDFIKALLAMMHPE